jgi:Gram-negative bacterial TonB protein C-terminal
MLILLKAIKQNVMPKIKSISLAFCCTEKLSKQLNCKTCSKTITDFRGKSLNFLRDELANSNQSVCGIFNRSQLNHNFLQYSAATLLVAGTLNLSFCSSELNDIRPTLKVNETEIDIPFTGLIVETMAEPIGGYEKFYRAIQSQTTFPAGLSENGRCFVEILINSTGEIGAVKLLKGFHPLADQEAVRVLTSMNFPFKPAEQGGKRVDQKIIVQLIFDPPGLE